MIQASFNFDRPIYRQIADIMEEHILRGEWAEGERIPAVRELAMKLQVNPNTVMRAYESLQKSDAIESRRGMGYFVAPDAVENIRKRERDMFMMVELPGIFEYMKVLGITMDDINKRYEILKKR